MTDTKRVPDVGRLAGVDYGHVRIGVAICDSTQSIASPHANYTRRSEAEDEGWFQQLVESEGIVGFVVGLPVHGSGAESQKSREARRFGAWLAEVTNRPVVYYDERYTTTQAEQILGAAELTRKRRKERLDKLAAQIMLTAFLESSDGSRHDPGALDDGH